MSKKSTSLPKDFPLMPGSFAVEDYIDFYENPLDALDQLQQAWRSKEHARPWSVLPELDLTDVDWHKYSPSEVMRKAPHITSDILLEIIETSILNVQTRVDNEEQKKRADEQRRAAEEAERRDAAKSDEPYLPIKTIHVAEGNADGKKQVENEAKPIVADDNPAVAARRISLNRFTVQVKPSGMGGLIVLPTSGEKIKKFTLRNLFARVNEKGQGSLEGERKREALRRRIRSLAESAGDEPDERTKNILERSKSIGLFSQQDGTQQEEEPLVECVSCLDDFSRKDTVKVPCHHYCKDCFVRLVNAAIASEQQWPPKCCLNEIPRKVILASVPKDLAASFREHASEMDVPLSDRIYCNEPTCAEWIRPDNINHRKRQGRCSRGHSTCTLCRGTAHGRGECPQDRDMNLTNALAEQEGWKRCFNCQALVEHAEACQHMTCRCGTQFCYVCGLRWRTCSCTMQQLDAVKRAAEDRREARLLRENAEAEELRQALVQIEEFEREEALKAELLRQEQERLEAERQQQELEERVRLESLRRQEVEVKYQELREILNTVRDLQAGLLDEQQDEDAIHLAKTTIAAKKDLEEKQGAERMKNVEFMAVQLSTRELELQRDYIVRATAEKKIEEEYHQQLLAFWADKPDRESRVEAAMAPLRCKMDSGYKAYQRWKSDMLETYKAHLRDEQTIKEEIMYSAKQRMNDLYGSREADLIKRAASEKKWMKEIVLEREKLLGEREVEEMEGDADSLFAAERGVGSEGDSAPIEENIVGPNTSRDGKGRDVLEEESAWYSADEEFGEPQGPVDNGEGSWRIAAAKYATFGEEEEQVARTWAPTRGGIREANDTVMEEVAREFEREVQDPWVGVAH